MSDPYSDRRLKHRVKINDNVVLYLTDVELFDLGQKINTILSEQIEITFTGSGTPEQFEYPDGSIYKVK